MAVQIISCICMGFHADRDLTFYASRLFNEPYLIYPYPALPETGKITQNRHGRKWVKRGLFFAGQDDGDDAVQIGLGHGRAGGKAQALVKEMFADVATSDSGWMLFFARIGSWPAGGKHRLQVLGFSNRLAIKQQLKTKKTLFLLLLPKIGMIRNG